jgi:hypothetical protein
MFSDHASDNVKESDEQNEPKNDKNLSEKLSNTHTKQQPNNCHGDDISATSSIQGSYSNSPTTATPINQQPAPPTPPAGTIANVLADVIMGETSTPSPNCRHK